MNTFEAQITDELQCIVPVVEELTGLPSRWSGKVELVPDAEFRGKKRFSCLIQLDALLAQQERRWFTLIHEALHCVSAGYNAVDYRDYPGWEEGVVEKMQRLLRPQILARLGVNVASDLIAEVEQKHRYQIYIEALEKIRLELKWEEPTFYPLLLQTPIKERPGTLFRKGNQQSGIERIEFIRVFSSSSAILRGFTTLREEP